VGGVRWWNVLHPTRYAELLAAGASPAAGREMLSPAQRRMERTMLEIRLADGLVLGDDDAAAADAAAARLAEDGLLEPDALAAGRARLTLDGRLLADHVARTLVAARERAPAAVAA
jgi:oxygen-independent coproporphyrinogen-3 oxidase